MISGSFAKLRFYIENTNTRDSAVTKVYWSRKTIFYKQTQRMSKKILLAREIISYLRAAVLCPFSIYTEFTILENYSEILDNLRKPLEIAENPG